METDTHLSYADRHRVAMGKYYGSHRSKILAQKRQYYHDNKDEMNQRSREYYQLHAEALKEKRRQRYQARKAAKEAAAVKT